MILLGERRLKQIVKRWRMRYASWGDMVFDVCNYSLMLVLCVVMLYPMLNTLAISLNDANDAIRGGFIFGLGSLHFITTNMC